MNFPQPKVDPLPLGINLHGKTAVITGATAGIGLETARQLLQLNLSRLILAVRNVSKGKSCKQGLQQYNQNSEIIVLELDMDNYKSVQGFAKTLQQEVSSVDILLLNAGIGLLKLEQSPSGHEKVTQVNYYSNVLLVAELLPYLQASAQKTGHPSRITWVGSRMYFTTSFEKQAPVKASESVLEHMDAEKFFFPYQRYNDTKLLCAMFMYSLAQRLDNSKIILNMVCPGLVNTSMTDILPLYMRMVMGVVKAFLARPVETGGQLFVNAAVVAGPESHGGFLGDKNVIEPSPYILSPVGQTVQQKLWAETIEEMQNLTDLPPEFTL